MGERLRVLIVEDNPGDARLLQEVLRESRSMQIEWQHVTRLADGLAALQGGALDLVLLDLSLPDARGLEAARFEEQARARQCSTVPRRTDIVRTPRRYRASHCGVLLTHWWRRPA
jgi:CheY-like chemotaxis protein